MENFLFLQNIRSLGANFDEFISYLQSTETWLREFPNLQIFTQSPYKRILSGHKKSGRGGGVALLAKDKSCLSRVLSKSTKNFQILTTNYRTHKVETYITIVYKSPSFKSKEFIESRVASWF